MTPNKNIKIATVVATLLFASNVMANTGAALIKEQPRNVYHVIKNKTLLEATNQLANRSGIVFKISADIERDAVNKKLAADDWGAAIGQLLQDYNFTVETENNNIKTVLVTGRHGSGNGLKNISVKEDELIVVAPDYAGKIPGKYKHFNAGSVFNVALPMEQLNNIAVGGELTLDLPIGQYKVKHDNRVEHGDGSSTWVGYLGDEGQGYRIYLSQGEAGVIGNVYTPDGAYNIETVDGQTVIVDIDKSGLDSAGYDHDEAEAAPETLALMENGLQMGGILSDLQQAAEKARAIADALAKEAQTLYTQYQQDLARAEAARAQAGELAARSKNTGVQLNAALSALRKSPRNAQLISAVTQLRAEQSQLAQQTKLANAAYKAANKAMAASKSAYNKKVKQANVAEANAKKAEAVYAAKNTNSTTAVTSSTAAPVNTVVDLMVLYTTVNQTASYAKQRIQYLVDVSNQAYKDSGINMSLRLVHARSTHYVENNANSQALTDLASDAGAFAGTAALRNQYGADLVVLFRPLYAQTAGSCGTAYVGFANGGNANANLGFGTIGDGYSKDAKSNYYCGTNTFTHEIGHNLGNVHDREYSNFTGKFNYSYAWGISGKFGTIMSYYGPSVMLFSTPALSTQCAGSPCGFAEGDAKASDQTKTINYTAPLVAGYRPNMVSVPVIQ
ncbi:reprolysin-like metallopeptidase [Methylomonas rivi]|uniref:Zinc-dependent metalloprotease n=1 Tax=Methylomonas rivi TaxID=2952226 RepID=A0ABT1U970_9GAMM|nr:zinc-dependent metalloprotease family protein [Methylomonas sp. WSC-6]MCQ8130403.1 zinc-dependent metalloprotease [Methylomonas sp. WSC-6]